MPRNNHAPLNDHKHGLVPRRMPDACPTHTRISAVGAVRPPRAAFHAQSDALPASVTTPLAIYLVSNIKLCLLVYELIVGEIIVKSPCELSRLSCDLSAVYLRSIRQLRIRKQCIVDSEFRGSCLFTEVAHLAPPDGSAGRPPAG